MKINRYSCSRSRKKVEVNQALTEGRTVFSVILLFFHYHDLFVWGSLDLNCEWTFGNILLFDSMRFFIEIYSENLSVFSKFRRFGQFYKSYTSLPFKIKNIEKKITWKFHHLGNSMICWCKLWCKRSQFAVDFLLLLVEMLVFIFNDLMFISHVLKTKLLW